MTVTVDALTDCLNSMSPRERTSFLLSLGVPAIQVLGVRCDQHQYGAGRLMGDMEPLRFGHSKWCVSCHRWVVLYVAC